MEVLVLGGEGTATYERGDYTVKLVVSTSAGYLDSVSIPVSIVGPVGDFEVDKDSICLGETITFSLKDTLDFGLYQWEFGDGTTTENDDPASHVYDEYPLGWQTVVKLVFSDKEGGCTNSAEKNIYIRDVFADFDRGLNDNGFRICLNESIPFSSKSSNADVFDWEFGDGKTSKSENPTHSYDEAGVYEVVLSVENSEFGCTDDVQKTVVVDPLPNVEALGDTICKGYNATLTVLNPNPNYSYKWTSDDFGIANDTAAVSTTDNLNKEGTFTATVKVLDKDSGCDNMIDVDVVVIGGLPIVSERDTVDVSENITINENGGSYDFEWTQVMDTSGVKANLSCTNCPSPSFIVPKGASELVYEATVRDGQCDSVIWTFVYVVIDVETPIYPKVFTPNGDGKNEYFYPIFNSPATADYAVITDLRIFNRWGAKIYDNDNPEKGWDGTVNGKPAPQDVYLYFVSGFFPGKEDQPFSNHGDITLLR